MNAPANTPWGQTVGGKQWDFLNPSPETVVDLEIAWTLSQICRFGGASVNYLSVAQHSVHVASHLEMEGEDVRTILLGLLHDAHEAYLGDLTTPFQDAMDILRPGFKDGLRLLKRRADAAIHAAFGVDKMFEPAELVAANAKVRAADLAVLMGERQHHMIPDGPRWDDDLEAITPSPHVMSQALSPRQAADLFMAALRGLLEQDPSAILKPAEAA
jgi:hypothetical protein